MEWDAGPCRAQHSTMTGDGPNERPNAHTECPPYISGVQGPARLSPVTHLSILTSPPPMMVRTLTLQQGGGGQQQGQQQQRCQVRCQRYHAGRGRMGGESEAAPWGQRLGSAADKVWRCWFGCCGNTGALHGQQAREASSTLPCNAESRQCNPVQASMHAWAFFAPARPLLTSQPNKGCRRLLSPQPPHHSCRHLRDEPRDCCCLMYRATLMSPTALRLLRRCWTGEEQQQQAPAGVKCLHVACLRDPG